MSAYTRCSVDDCHWHSGGTAKGAGETQCVTAAGGGPSPCLFGLISSTDPEDLDLVAYADEECERVCEAEAAKDECGQYLRTCGGCGFQWRSNHCIHDGVQNPCPECGWKLPGTRSPLEFLGFGRPS